MKWGFLVLVEDAHPFATSESTRGLATRMLDQLRAEPRLPHLRAGVAYTAARARLVHVARVFGGIEAKDEHEAEAVLSRAVPAGLGVADRRPVLYFWPAN